MEFIIILLILIFIVWKIYEFVYYRSEKFIAVKNSISNHINNCNELNEHINDLKNTYAGFEQIDYGSASFNDDSNWSFKRKELSKVKESKYVYNCSLSVCKNAGTQPFKYLCKYFNIKANEETLSKFEEALNNFSAAEQGKTLLIEEKKTILDSIINEIPFLIKKFSKKKLEKKLGFDNVDLNTMYFPKYTFSYVSPGGNKSESYDIILDIDNLERFIKYLSNIVKFKKTVAGQRALMTPYLREKIKKRDNYTCQSCGVSINQEPHLLLEIDHIVPLSKGGLTTEDNLQTLCWKCNRTKGSKIR